MSNALAIQLLKNELAEIKTRREVVEKRISQTKSELMRYNKELITIIEHSSAIEEAVKTLKRTKVQS